MRQDWLLLIYTVPAEPTRKRAFIWRELKKVGAPYLRDGVCILPERPDTLARRYPMSDTSLTLSSRSKSNAIVC